MFPDRSISQPGKRRPHGLKVPAAKRATLHVSSSCLSSSVLSSSLSLFFRSVQVFVNPLSDVSSFVSRRFERRQMFFQRLL